MAYKAEPGSTIVAQYSTPTKGTWNSLAVHAIPQDALYDSLNVFLRRGKLRTRPGLQPINAGIFDNAILGALHVVTPTSETVIAVSRSTLYNLSATATEWHVSVNTAGAFANADDAVIDIALLETSGKYVGIIAEQSVRLKEWNGTSHAVSPITIGDPDPTISDQAAPLAKSVCIAGRRLIMLIPPHTVRWTPVFQYNVYPPLALTRLAQTGDLGVCVRALSNLSFAVYKERSIHVARAQAGSGDETAFAFAEPIMAEGPAGVHAVVNMQGTHIYMTRNGRVALFDGTRYPQWIADGLWLFLQDDIDQRYAHMIYGVYDYRLHMVMFTYPKRGDSGKLRGIVFINIPYEGMDIAQAQQQPLPAAFKGVLAHHCTMACEMRFQQTINRSLVFSADQFNMQAHVLSEDAENDDGETYQCSIQLPLVAMPNAVHTRVSIESFFERQAGFGSVLIEPVISDGLEAEAGYVPDLRGKIINLERNPIIEHVGFDIPPTRFFGVKYSWDSRVNVRYAGTIIHGRPLMAQVRP